MKKGQLLLLPNLLFSEAHHEVFLPKSVDKAVLSLDGLIAENEKEGRAYLKRFGANFRELSIVSFNEHSQEVDELLAPMKKGEKWGLISDAGLPIIADPGYQLVRRARDFGIVVRAFVGPSAMTLALMLSGLPSQHFTFHGYPPRKETEEWLREMEKRSKDENATQLFILPPYKNQQMLELLLQVLGYGTELCVAWDLTMPTQGVERQTIAEWKRRTLPNIHKKPAIFLFKQNRD